MQSTFSGPPSLSGAIVDTHGAVRSREQSQAPSHLWRIRKFAQRGGGNEILSQTRLFVGDGGITHIGNVSANEGVGRHNTGGVRIRDRVVRGVAELTGVGRTHDVSGRRRPVVQLDGGGIGGVGVLELQCVNDVSSCQIVADGAASNRSNKDETLSMSSDAKAQGGDECKDAFHCIS